MQYDIYICICVINIYIYCVKSIVAEWRHTISVILVKIDLDNGLSLIRRQDITWTSFESLLISY